MEYKGFQILSDGTFGLWFIKALGRGSVPKNLRGQYTTAVMAQKDIDLHVNSKGKTNGGTKPTSGV
ncbi:MAG: hypothetical protein AAFN81_08290 [Bacteroidota bacterium]